MRDFTIEGWTRLTDAEWGAANNYNNTLFSGVGSVRLLVRPGSASPLPYLGFFAVSLRGQEFVLQPKHIGLSNTGEWVHWALERHLSTLSVYRDGQLIDQRADLPGDAEANLRGGMFAGRDGSYPIKGEVDAIAIFDRALNADQLSNHYQAGVSARAASAP
jgi:hypothetical protein